MTQPKGYESLNDPPAPQHCFDGPMTNQPNLGPVLTCCFCRKPQREFITVPQEGHGPYGPHTAAIRDHTDGICPERREP